MRATVGITLGTAVIVLLAGPIAALRSEEKKRPVLPDNKTIDTFEYGFTPKVLGSAAALTIGRDGKIAYSFQSQPHTGSGGHVVQKEWKIPEGDAAALLDGLVEDGVLELEDTGGGKYPNHHVAASYGRWRLSIHPKELPGKVFKRLLPLLQKAHPEEWKATPGK